MNCVCLKNNPLHHDTTIDRREFPDYLTNLSESTVPQSNNAFVCDEDNIVKDENSLDEHRFNSQESLFITTIPNVEEFAMALGKGLQRNPLLTDHYC